LAPRNPLGLPDGLFGPQRDGDLLEKRPRCRRRRREPGRWLRRGKAVPRRRRSRGWPTTQGWHPACYDQRPHAIRSRPSGDPATAVQAVARVHEMFTEPSETGGDWAGVRTRRAWGSGSTITNGWPGRRWLTSPKTEAWRGGCRRCWRWGREPPSAGRSDAMRLRRRAVQTSGTDRSRTSASVERRRRGGHPPTVATR
jgi:hypothetical protein